MSEIRLAESANTRAIGLSFPIKLFVIFAVLVGLSLTISIGGKWLGRSIALAGHTTDVSQHRILIGDNIIHAPANTIRFAEQRRDGLTRRLDLYLRWPELDGYSDAARDQFNHANDSQDIIFLLFEERLMSRDMSGRLEPVYESMLQRPGTKGPGGTTFFAFDQETGYLNELLAIARKAGKEEAFVARCLVGESARESLAPCERDIHLGNELSLTYRFPAKLLGSWESLDAAIRAKASEMLASVN